MLSSKALLPVCLYISLLFATSSYAHIQRDHAHLNLKRLVKKRSPADFPDLPIVPIGVAGAGSIPSSSSSDVASSTSASVSPSLSSSSAAASSTTPASSSTASSDASSSTSASESSSSPVSSTSDSSSSSSSTSASASASSISSAAPAAKTSQSLNLTGQQTSVSTVAGQTITRTQSVDAAQQTSDEPAPLGAAAKSTSTTMTALIAVAASIGGLAILWTIFRKWKLSSSKKFDQRLNPIDWQPTTGEDDIIPSHRRVPSGSSARSGSTRRQNASDPLDHDFTAGPTSNSPVGGYADLARGTSPIPPMQENNLARGPSFNRGYGDYNVPLHHQTSYGSQDAYNYNGGNTRY